MINELKSEYAVPVYNRDNLNSILDSNIQFTVSDCLFLDTLLLRIQGETIRFASHIKKKEKLEENKLIEILKNLENPSLPDFPKLEDTKSKRKPIRELKVKGNLIRSRVINNVHYEKPTKFFADLKSKDL